MNNKQSRRTLQKSKQRQTRRTTKSSTPSTILSDDLVAEILLRLPVRSLLCFRSVCKSWLSRISDPDFRKSHFDLAASPTYRYVQNVNDSSVIESRDINASLHEESSVVRHKTPLKTAPYFMGSCRGFILVIDDRCNTFVWNPSNGVKKRIKGMVEPNGVDEFFEKLIGFGYDMSTDDYLIVLIYNITDRRDFIVYYSLRTGLWSSAYANFPYEYPLADLRVGSFLNQALHWLVKSSHTNLSVIIAFDLVGRVLSEISLSDELAMELKSKQKQYHLRVMEECLSLCCPGGNGRVASKAEIWIMKDYNVQSSWTKLFVCSTSNISRHRFIPICITKRSQIFGSNGRGRIMIFNHTGQLIDQCTTSNGPDKYKLDEEDCDIYRESLLSLPSKQTKITN